MSGQQQRSSAFFLVLLMVLLSAQHLIVANSKQVEWSHQGSPSIVSSTSGRAQTTWSGTVPVTSDYFVGVSDELIIQSCTVVQMAANTRIYVDGRLTIEGTTSCPVVLQSSSLVDHEGIQFNASSNSRGSNIQNLTIEDAIYGVTIYSSNPIINNLTVVNPDRVAVDMFNNAAPRMNDLRVEQAGRNIGTPFDWRYGIGLSVGAGSTPIINRASFSDILTRGVNYWGASGGLIRGIHVDNCSGATLATVAGIWVEDSQPLLTDITVDKCDTGMLIRHMDDSGYTHAVVRNATISNSMYRGVYVDKNNHTNYTNYETADFTDLTIRGTGTTGAKTANIGEAALEVNATGAWFENTVIEDSTTVGVRLYFVDSTTTFRNLTILDSGDPGQGPHEAGLAIRSSNFAASFENIEISGSVGPGISSTSGGGMQGVNWLLHNNSHEGLRIDRATVVVDGIELNDNGYAGAFVFDARYVTFENLSSVDNGKSASAIGVPERMAGLAYIDSNDIESASGDVRCRNCSVTGSSGSGIYAKNSVDLWLENIELGGNSMTTSELFIDNQDTMPTGALGSVYLTNLLIRAETPSIPALSLNRVAAHIDQLQMPGNHTGIEWIGDNNGNYPSSISRSELSGTGCLTLSDHPALAGFGNTISTSCIGGLTLQNSQVNWSTLTDESGLQILTLDSTSSLHLHRPSNLDLSLASIASGATIDVAWDVTVWVINNNFNGIPYAHVNASFSDFEPAVEGSTNELGRLFFENFIGQQWTSSGASPMNEVNIICGYDSTSNSTTATLDDDQLILCHLPLSNQPPFLRWVSPMHGAEYASHGMVEFNASTSWDLDNDTLSFTWTSSLDGDIVANCSGSWQSPNGPENGVPFIANSNDMYQCELSDGIHILTLEVCDDAGHCVSESRTIELVNQPPILVVSFEPGLNPWDELIMPQTGTVVINTTGTSDPEGDLISCMIVFEGYSSSGMEWDGMWGCPEQLTWTFDHTTTPPPMVFQLNVIVWDEIGNNDTFTVDVMLYNEIPQSNFSVVRDSNYSESLIHFDGSQTVDSEGDLIYVTYQSSIDGVLAVYENGQTNWTGYLSRGVHTITMFSNDQRAEHINQSSMSTTVLVVENSPPHAMIASPEFSTYDSSELIQFSAEGSGDFDSACSTYPSDLTWHCSEREPYGGSEFLVVTWESDLDGRLTPVGQDWLIFERRLSVGTHQLSLTLDDGINSEVLAMMTVNVTPSAPVIELISPIDNSTLSSSDGVQIDASLSVDYDGDDFTMTVRSSLASEPLIVDADPTAVHWVNLNAGEHQLSITMTDSTGRSREEIVHITVIESAPILVIHEPENRASISPGVPLRLNESSYDADNDLIVREWRIWNPSLSYPTILSTNSKDTITSLLPGEYHLSLYIEDSRGHSVEQHMNITIQSSLPTLDSNSLTLSSTTFVADEKNILEVSVRMEDKDGTTNHVFINITHNIQQWQVNLTDLDGDGVWTGSVEWIPQGTGRPNLRIVAMDGVGDDATFDMLTRTLIVEEEESDTRMSTFVVALGGALGGLGLLAFLISRRRRAQSDLDILTSWDAFRQPTSEPQGKLIPELKEGHFVDSTGEVQAELDDIL